MTPTFGCLGAALLLGIAAIAAVLHRGKRT